MIAEALENVNRLYRGFQLSEAHILDGRRFPLRPYSSGSARAGFPETLMEKIFSNLSFSSTETPESKKSILRLQFFFGRNTLKTEETAPTW